MKPRTHEVVSKLTKAMGELLEKQPDSPVPAGVASLTDAYDRLGAVLKKTTDGTLPDGMAAELKTIAGLLLAVAGDAGTAAPAAGAAATTPAVPAVPVAAAAEKSLAALRKLELDDYTAVRVTIDSACSRLWGVQDLLRSNKMDDAMAELSGITASLTNLASLGGAASGGATAAPAAEKAMKSVEMTAEQFYTWMNEQLEVAKTEAPAEAHARLAAVKNAVDTVQKVFQESPEPRGPFTFEIADAYVPNNMGTALDLTTKTDQKDTDASVTAGLPNGAGDDPGTHNFGVNMGAVSNAIGVAMGSLLTDGGPALNTTFKADGTPIEKADDAFIWPGDMTLTDPDYVDPKSEKKSRPADTDALGWGKDPWANSHR